MVSDSIHIILVFGLIGLITNSIAWKKGFYHLISYPAPKVCFRDVGTLFAIYIGVSFFLASYFRVLIQKFAQTESAAGTLILLQFVLIILLLMGFYFYCHTQARGLFVIVWKNPAAYGSSSPFYDFMLGITAWMLAFPIVQVVGQLLDLVLFLIFRLEAYEQVAVKYLKTAFQSPAQTILALLSIVIIAPVVEEFLFRGTLQNYLKRRLQPKTAILITSLCFGLFHYSLEQGVGNISLIGSLFVFGCFLGYIYERQGSLYASIGLHLAFNFVSSARILFS